MNGFLFQREECGRACVCVCVCVAVWTGMALGIRTRLLSCWKNGRAPRSWDLGAEGASSQAFSGPGRSGLRICSAQSLPVVPRPPLPAVPSSLLAPISSSSWLPSEAPAHLPRLLPASPTVPSFCPGDGGRKEAQLVRLTWA